MLFYSSGHPSFLYKDKMLFYSLATPPCLQPRGDQTGCSRGSVPQAWRHDLGLRPRPTLLSHPFPISQPAAVPYPGPAELTPALALLASYRAGPSLWVAQVRVAIAFTQLTVAKVESTPSACVA